MTIKTHLKRFALSLAASLLIAGAVHADTTKAPIRLATTTSTEQSGLLGWLLPQFTKETGYPVQVMAAGTGQSLKMGENGDADLVMTHAPSAEKAFVDAGFGIEPAHLMLALLDQQGGTVRPLLEKSGAKVSVLRSRLGEALDRLPKVEGTGGEIHVSNDLGKLLNLTDKLDERAADDGEYLTSWRIRGLLFK
jgi:hypothetical protein